MDRNTLTYKIIGCAIEVHRLLGLGLPESAYEECLCYELEQNDLEVKRQVGVPVIYKDIKLECGYRIDILVENQIIIELKSMETLAPIHEAQILTYMKLADKATGLLLNFNVSRLTEGIKRYVL